MTRVGSTLLEGVVAVAILSMTIVFVLGVVAQHVDGASRAEARLTAAHLAEQSLEAVRSVEAGRIRARVGESSEGGFAEPFATFRWHMAIRMADTALSLIQVDVTITWDGGRFQLSSLLYRPVRGPAPWS